MNVDKLKEEVLNYIRFDKPGVEKLLRKCEELYVTDDGIIDFKDEKEWDEEYFYELFPAIRKNFSKEKVMELLKVHDKIRGKVKEYDTPKKYTQSSYLGEKKLFNSINGENLKEEVLNCIRFDKPGVEKLLRKCEELYVTDDRIIDFKDEKEWDEEYFYELFPATRKNFSKEKVEELLKVHDKIRGKVEEEVEENFKESDFHNENRKKVKKIKKIEEEHDKEKKPGLVKVFLIGVGMGVIVGYKTAKEYIKNNKNRGKK